jgi:hypothetical protein
MRLAWLASICCLSLLILLAFPETFLAVRHIPFTCEAIVLLAAQQESATQLQQSCIETDGQNVS